MHFIVPCALFFSIFSSCSAQTVLNVPLSKASAMLSQGDVQFIGNAAPEKMHEVSRINPAAPFYAALLLERREADGDTKEKCIALLTEALKCPEVRGEAAKKLVSYDGDRFFKESQTLAWISESGDWARAFNFFSAVHDSGTQKTSVYGSDLMSFFLDEPLGDPHKWLFMRLQDYFQEAGGIFSDWDTAADLVRGRMAAARLSYGEAFRCFRSAFGRENRKWFFSHRELLSDVGKAFQYAAPREGLKFFSEWENAVIKPRKPDELSASEALQVRYRLIYFSGRMARQLKKSEDAAGFFENAIPYAPDMPQKDACIWYLLDSVYDEKDNGGKFVRILEKYAAQWGDGGYFSDILDRFSAWAARQGRWELIRRVFFAINGYADKETSAKYAFITGRSLDLGLMPRRDDSESAEYFYTAAYQDEIQGDGPPSFYYRARAAGYLGKPLALDRLITAKDSGASAKDSGKPAPPSSTYKFLELFFKFGCAAYAYPYVRAVREELSLDELRSITAKFTGAGEYQAAVNMTLFFMCRRGYRLTKFDLQLSYPRGYKEIIEKNAERARISPALLFALVRRESVFDPAAHSRAGALGLTQLMERTGNEMARILARNGGQNYVVDGETDLLNPNINSHLGALYYKQLESITKSPLLALLAYNGGIGRVRRWQKARPALPDDLFLETVEFRETRGYGRGVLDDQIVYDYLYY
ncbi:MAG: lytic transglycosylase domain-containing protein [Spirochaetaceae bacterium]|jgi:soluble lytic murein transglycosylase|nr:lytic transglycosylase domain-containing protein [Spirochaetaceae bacterium]